MNLAGNMARDKIASAVLLSCCLPFTICIKPSRYRLDIQSVGGYGARVECALLGTGLMMWKRKAAQLGRLILVSFSDSWRLTRQEKTGTHKKAAEQRTKQN